MVHRLEQAAKEDRDLAHRLQELADRVSSVKRDPIPRDSSPPPAHSTVGRGHLYQGRFKCFPVEEDTHFFTVCRYVARNALTARVVERAEDWRWGSHWARRHGDEQLQAILSDSRWNGRQIG